MTSYNASVKRLRANLLHREIKWFGIWLTIYFLTHLIYLTALPVFADEAIYIRWSQLMIDDLPRYLFFPLNDGKTPLFIWMLFPFQYLFDDPLFAGRFVSVLGGAVQLVFVTLILKALGGKRFTQTIGALFVTFLPFWFIHHRMALMDGWLTVWIAGASLAVIKLNTQAGLIASHQQFVRMFWRISYAEIKRLWSLNGAWMWWGGIFLGAALYTKIPALLAVPSLFALTLLPPLESASRLISRLIRVGVLVAIGLLIFLTLKISAAFPQLIFRGSDFLYPVSDVLLHGAWQQTLINAPTYFSYYWWYLTPGVVVLIIAGLFETDLRRQQLVLILASLSFVFPIVVLGKVVYPRYLMPSVLYLTVAAALAASFYLERVRHQMMKISVAKQIVVVFISIMLIQQIITPSLVALTYAWTDVSSYPYVPADKEQYLTKWSSGHGIYQFVNLLQTQAAEQKIAVATEGFFGTLPDGVLMYLHRTPVENIYVEGAGQPVNSIPQVLIDRQSEFDRLWILVNSHRITFDITKEYLVAEYCRPFDAPCLQVWDVTEIVRNGDQYK